jgi:hypothetical protein
MLVDVRFIFDVIDLFGETDRWSDQVRDYMIFIISWLTFD